MSTKYVSSKGANVKLVQNRKPLARAIALALMAGAAGAWVAAVKSLKLHKLCSTGKYEISENSVLQSATQGM
jgi:hypothetical protein